MKVLLRADASPKQGTGHVMRCLTLSEALVARGHEVLLMTNESTIPWLEKKVDDANIQKIKVVQHTLDIELINNIRPDWVVFDSYVISPAMISSLNSEYKTLAIIDGDSRGIEASLYLDHNLGAEQIEWHPDVRNRLLAGSNYVLIRNAILDQLSMVSHTNNVAPHLVAVMGGSDPTGTIVKIATAVASISGNFTATFVVGEQWAESVKNIVRSRPGVEITAPTSNLPSLFGKADIAISAAGTSAWELCTLGKPSLLLAVVDNQVESLEQLVDQQLVLGIDLTHKDNAEVSSLVASRIEELINDEALRDRLSTRCMQIFDGRGKDRVVLEMEYLAGSSGSKVSL